MDLLTRYWWLLTMSALFALWAWRAARRARAFGSAESSAPFVPRGPLTTTPRFRRGPFADEAERVRRGMAKGMGIAVVLFIVGMPALFAINAWQHGLPNRVFEAAILVICFGSVVLMIVSAQRGSRRMREFGLICPNCKGELVGTIQNGAWIQDRVLETGQCPRCHTQLLDPAEVGPVPSKLTLGGHLQAIGIIAFLTLGLAGTVYFGNASIRAKRLAYCNRHYGNAHTAADSATVDSLRPSRKAIVTCGDLRGQSPAISR